MALSGGFAAVALYHGAASLSIQTDKVATTGARGAVVSNDVPQLFAAPETFKDSTGSIGTVGVGRRDALHLSDEQRGQVFVGVINLPDVPDADITPRLTTGWVPPSVALHDLPAMVTNGIPRMQGYKFAKLWDRILVVDPGTRNVVADIPRYHLVR